MCCWNFIIKSTLLINIDVSTTIHSVTQPSTAMSRSNNLIEGWNNTLPTHDHQWVSSALFKRSHKGKPAFDSSKANKLWYYPPQPSLIPTQPPAVSRYFAKRLLLWMPRKLWQVKLAPGCGKYSTLTGTTSWLQNTWSVQNAPGN